MVALGQARDEIVRVGQLRGADAVVVRGVELAVADVVHDRAGEEVDVLQDDAERVAQVGLLMRLMLTPSYLILPSAMS